MVVWQHGSDVITVRILHLHCRIFDFELAARYSSVVGLLLKCVTAKGGAELISPSLLENIPKRSKECHERFRLDMGSGLSRAMKFYRE